VFTFIRGIFRSLVALHHDAPHVKPNFVLLCVHASLQLCASPRFSANLSVTPNPIYGIGVVVFTFTRGIFCSLVALHYAAPHVKPNLVLLCAHASLQLGSSARFSANLSVTPNPI